MVKLASFDRRTITQKLIDSNVVTSRLRPYLGMSSLAHPCSRLLWLGFRWCYLSTHSPRLIRLFDRGHREEPVIIEMLEKIGIKVTGSQKEYSQAWGHCLGHCDGLCENVPDAPKAKHLLEIKTMNDKSFKLMADKGVKIAKPVYYGQCQIYMREEGINRTLFIAVNKNDDTLHIERVKLDKGYADDMVRKAESIILAAIPPVRKFPVGWYECGFCDAKAVCFGLDQPERSCRSCTQVEIMQEGNWGCGKIGKVLTIQDQKNACRLYSQVGIL